MPDEQPLPLSQVLAEEYQVLRSQSSFNLSEPDPALSDSKAIKEARRAELYLKIHRHPEPLSALCISGGGIRSATFGLGVLQGLADYGLLDRFDYLSAVSGGGYIGGWLKAWAHRAGGLEKILPCLKTSASPPDRPELNPVQHLRNFSNYLTPRVGFFSADTWTLSATILRNLALNWIVLIPLLLAVVMVPRIAVTLAGLDPALNPDLQPYGGLLIRATRVVDALLFSTAIFNLMRFLPSVGNKEHKQSDFLRLFLSPLVGSAVLRSTFFVWLYRNKPQGVPRLLELAGEVLLLGFAGWLAYLLVYEVRRGLRKLVRLVFGPVTVAGALGCLFTGLAAWIFIHKAVANPQVGLSLYVTLGAPLLLTGLGIGGVLFVGLSSEFLKDEDREWLARAGAWLLLFSVTWAAACALVLLVPVYVLQWESWAIGAAAALGLASGWGAALAGKSDTSAAYPGKAKSRSRKVELTAKLGPVLFLIAFLAGMSLLLDWVSWATGLVPEPWWNHTAIVEHSGLDDDVFLASLFFVLGVFLSRPINLNKFSLHEMYRTRLVRAFLGASNPRERVNKFTGFADNDDIPMKDLDPRGKPFLVLNMTLNLMAGTRMAWQERMAESFTVTALHSGNWDLGYRPSDKYGGRNGISLGTAITISGAAANPHMGYHSSPALGFIMTLFNARLGRWLGNPIKKTWRQDGPRSALASLVKEALGLSNNTSEYVNLSDGYHFENLGLYEMVLRRCRYIVVLDNGEDKNYTYEDLGNALRKIRIDLKIPIDSDEAANLLFRERKKRCAVATIRYSSVDGPGTDGYLIYIKPMVIGGEPPDVQSYYALHQDFPHESTADQWFSESQMECYRMLGWYTIEELCRGWKGGQLSDFIDHVRTTYLGRSMPQEARAGAGSP